MRDFLKSMAKLAAGGASAAVGFAAVILTIGLVQASSLSLRTGPMPAADLLSTVNTLVNNINTCCAPGGTGTPSAQLFIGGGAAGKLRLLSANSWTANGSTATSVTSLGPAGASTTGWRPRNRSQVRQFHSIRRAPPQGDAGRGRP